MFTTYMFGHAPQAPAKLDYEVKEVKKNALQGCVTRKQVTIYLTPEREQGIHINLQIYLPNSTEASKPVPIFLGISFLPNYTVYDDPDLHLPDNYIKPDGTTGQVPAQGLWTSRGN